MIYQGPSWFLLANLAGLGLNHTKQNIKPF